MGCKLCRSVKNFGNEENYLSSSDSQLLSECHKDGEDSNSIRELLFSGQIENLRFVPKDQAKRRKTAIREEEKRSEENGIGIQSVQIAPIGEEFSSTEEAQKLRSSTEKSSFQVGNVIKSEEKEPQVIIAINDSLRVCGGISLELSQRSHSYGNSSQEQLSDLEELIEEEKIGPVVKLHSENLMKNKKNKIIKTGYRHSIDTGSLMFSSKLTDQINKTKGRSPFALRASSAQFKINRVGELISNSYSFIGHIADGTFGKIKKVRHKPSGGIRALKILRKNRISENANPYLEFSVLKQLDHPNILRIFELFQDQHNVYIITECCEGGDFYQLLSGLKKMTERKAAKYMKALLSAVAYCHSRNIMHRDLKPENLMLDTNDKNSILKIIDFGCSKILKEDETLSDLIGTPSYFAPEVIKGEYDLKCDIWSCGVILYLMLGGYVPFTGAKSKEIKEKIIEGNVIFQFKDWNNISKAAINFIKRMLTYNPEERVSAREALKDTWLLQNINTKKKMREQSAIESFNRLLKFSSKEYFQKAVIAFITTNIQNQKEEYSLRKIFEKLDLNGDGQLSKEELLIGFSHLFENEDLAELEIDRIMSELDMNQNGFIDYSEFIMANLKTNQILSEDNMRMAFQAFDLDGDGYITIEELQNVLGPQICDEEEVTLFWNEFIAGVDINGDRQIDFQEFKIYMNKLLVNKRVKQRLSLDNTQLGSILHDLDKWGNC